MPYRNPLLFTILASLLLSATIDRPNVVHAQATFQINIMDGADEGFNDPGPPDNDSAFGGNSGATLGAQRRIAFSRATTIWAGLLNSSVTIVIDAQFDPLACDAATASLGAAGTQTIHANFIRAPIINTWYPAALANALAGTDLDPSRHDIVATFNSSLDGACPFPLVWYYGLDGNPPGGTLDFVTVVLHELAHGLGFQTFMDADDDPTDPTGTKLSGLDDAFLLWLEDHSTGELLSDMASDADRAAAIVNTGNLHWVGPDVIAAGAGLTSGRDPSGHVQMYAPNPLEPGSSVSHFSNALFPNELMEPSFTGANHDVGLALEVMRDIGWSSTAQPGAPSAGAAAGGDGGGGGGCFIGAVTGF